MASGNLPGQKQQLLVASATRCWLSYFASPWTALDGGTRGHIIEALRPYLVKSSVAGYIHAMSEPETFVRKTIYLPEQLAKEVADFRFATRANAEAEVFRVLIRAGLDALKGSSTKKRPVPVR
jgi:hypothetical protein